MKKIYRINQLKYNIHTRIDDIKKDLKYFTDFEIVRRSLDARNKKNILYSYNLDVKLTEDEYKKLPRNLKNELIEIEEKKFEIPKIKSLNKIAKPIIVGFGPAGIFAAYVFAKAGLKPIIFEKGKSVDTRLDEEVCFGEGGAGAFSDGKLTTRQTSDSQINKFILNTFINKGAEKTILYENLPHIGTNKLKPIIKKIREEILELGGEIYFENEICLKSLIKNYKNNKIFLATGHSSFNIYKELYENNFELEKKPFAIGYRFEHTQELIDKGIYGNISNEDLNLLGHASYKLLHKCSDGRSVYSFCMCPGGYVINSIYGEEKICTNGMSYHERNSSLANAAIVCNIKETDIKGDNPLNCLYFQNSIEEYVYKFDNGKIPQDSFGSFKKLKTNGINTILSLFVDFNINENIIEAVENFNNIIPGFSSNDVKVYAIEDRTSSCIRIKRNENYATTKNENIYPIGEGAGYAGGIMSSAIDGIKAAMSVISKLV